MRRLFVTSDGMAFRDKIYLRKRRQVRYMKRCLQSKGTKSAKQRLKKKARKENHMCKDMCYRAIKALLNSTDAPVLVMEDLKQIKQNTSRRKKKDGSEGMKRKKHNNAFHQVPIRMFRELLTYKAQLARRRVETVEPAYTSQTDSRTGQCDGIRKGCRYHCADGLVLDADWNAAVNIARKSSRPVSNQLPVDGGIRFLSGRPHVSRPNVGTIVHSHNSHLQAAQSLAAR
jgi:IS605 OrfB family transposase